MLYCESLHEWSQGFKYELFMPVDAWRINIVSWYLYK